MSRAIRTVALSLLSGLVLAGLGGCAQEVAGKGGTELPGPALVVVYDTRRDADASIATGLQWRLWERQDTVLLARASTTDSAGVLSLPNQSGTWVLEGWTDSLPGRSPVASSLRGGIPDSCIETAGSASLLRATKECAELPSPSVPDSAWPAVRRPVRVSAVRLDAGLPAVRLALADSLGQAIPGIGVARLWELDAGDSLRFVGELRRGSDGVLRMPRLPKAGWFALEAWPEGTKLPAEVDSRQPVGGRASGFARCGGQMPSFPQDESLLSIHECPALGIAPSLAGQVDSSRIPAPAHWALFGYQP